MAVDARSAVPTISPEAAASQQRRRRGLEAFGLSFPGAFWLIVFFVLPFIIIVVYSFLTRGPTGNVVWQFTTANYAKLVSDSVFIQVFLRSLWVGFLTTAGCLLLGYPMALYIARATPRWRTLLILLILIPFWTNFLVRTYAWMVILNNNGLINTIQIGRAHV